MTGESICAFENVTIEAAPPYEVPVRRLSFTAAGGDLVLVDLGGQHASLPLADAAQGLIEPDVGTVSFLGEDWAGLFPARAAGFRGRIGRVFDMRSWVSNLDVDENITLAQRHHTGRKHGEVMEEAKALARDFGLKEVPAARPALVPRRELRLAEWVRAFLGTPQLLILQEPLRGVPAEHLDPLLGKVSAALERSAAVIWITADERERACAAPQATAIFRRAPDGLTSITPSPGEGDTWPSRSNSDT